ncbi:hypothetical protein GCM10020254_74910 [Streptomyces goshikiensis]
MSVARGFGAGRRPLLERGVRPGRDGAPGEYAAGVARPELVGRAVLGAGGEAERASARSVGVGRAHVHLELDAAAFGQDQRRFEGQFLDEVAADLVPGPDRQVDEGGAGEQDAAHDLVVDQPGVSRGGEQGREDVAVGVGEGDGGAEQGVRGLVQPGGAHVSGPGARLDPVALALEGVGGQVVDAPGTGAGEVGVPVDPGAVGVGPGEGEGEALGLGAALAEHGDEDGALFHAVLGEGRQDAVGAEFDVRGHARGLKGADAVEEADGVADVPDPELGRAHLVGDQGAGQVRDDRDTRSLERQPRHHLAEVVEHAVHVGRVEGVADGEALGLAVRERLRDGDRRVLVTGDDHRTRTVDRRDADPVGQQRQDLLLGGLDGDHHATGRQRLHQPPTGVDQFARVLQGQHPGDVRGGYLTDRVPGEEVRLDTPGLQQPEERHLDREQRGLGVLGPVQNVRVRPEQDFLQRQFEVQPLAHRVQRGREHRVGLVQLAAHGQALAALTGEQEGDLPAGRRARHHSRRRFARRQRRETGQQALAVRGHDRGAVLEGRPADRQRPGDVDGAQPGVLPGVGQQPLGLSAQGVPALGRQEPGHGLRLRRRVTLGPVGLGGAVGLRGLLDDRVDVGAADAEGGDADPVRAPGLRPGALLGEQGDAAGRPVDVRGGPVHVQGLGQHAVPHRHDHLDDARDAGGVLGVAEVGLEGAQPQRPVRGAVLAVGGEQGLCLDGVAEGGAGAVGLDGVHVGGGQPGAFEGLADDALLGGAVGGGEPVAGAVLVDGRTPDDGQDPVPVAAGVGEAFHQQYADALGPAGAVRRLGEGLAAAVGGQAALPAELDEDLRAGEDGDAGGQGQRALPLAQGLDGHVQGRRRRTSRPCRRWRRGPPGRRRRRAGRRPRWRRCR